MMQLKILGCHSATPRDGKHTTSQLLEVGGHLFLIDCGEGTQIQLRKSKVKFARIQHIFISHLHGDHFYGLIGLISTFRLLGRTAPLHVYGPSGIKEIITLQLKLAKSWTDYPLFFHELSSSSGAVIFEDDGLTVSTIPLKHRVYTNGFLFTTKAGKRKINKEMVETISMLPYMYQALIAGEDLVLEDGTRYENKKFTLPPDPQISYAFCSDTAYNESIIPYITGVDVLYHEATFLNKHINLAERTLHSTAKQAAMIAQKAHVKKLVLGHYSNRYKDNNAFLEEASAVFKNVILAADFKNISF